MSGYVRLSKHQRQCVLLYLGGSVEAHGIDSLKKLWFPRKTVNDASQSLWLRKKTKCGGGGFLFLTAISHSL